MDKEIKCPKEDLERFLLLLGETNFKELDKEPSIEDARMLAGLMSDAKEGEEIPKEKIREEYKRIIRIKIKEQRGAEELSAYGQTQEEISGNLRKHVKGCYDCSKKYSDFVMERTIMRFRWSEKVLADNSDIYPPEVLECAQEEINLGLPALLKEEDESLLGLLK